MLKYGKIIITRNIRNVARRTVFYENFQFFTFSRKLKNIQWSVLIKTFLYIDEIKLKISVRIKSAKRNTQTHRQTLDFINSRISPASPVS